MSTTLYMPNAAVLIRGHERNPAKTEEGSLSGLIQHQSSLSTKNEGFIRFSGPYIEIMWN